MGDMLVAMHKPLIRSAQPRDAAALTRVIDAAYSIYAGRGLSLPPVSDGMAEAIADTPVFVAEGAAGIVGGVVLRLGPQAKIENLAVTPDGAGQGIGKALMARAEAAARQAGYDRLSLATHEGLAETLRFYARLGWVETGREGVRIFLARQLD
jgi:GNAT superfamily N-acetyltransferase